MNIRVVNKKLKVTLLILLSLIVVIGCNSGDEEEGLEDIDSPTEQDDQREEDVEEDVGEEDAETGTNARTLYLLTKDGIVVPNTFELPKTNEVATQAIEYLINDGPITELLPNGFEAVLPAGTEVLGLNLQEDGTIVVDLSEEFTEYDGNKEQQIIQAMTYTLTQFDGVERVKLWVNGFEQNVMPVNNMPIQNGYSRANGINILDMDAIDLMKSQAITLYYPSQIGANIYHVPVTQYVETSEGDLTQGIVEALLNGPAYDTSLLHVFNPNIELIDINEMDEGVVQVEFSEEILANVNEAYIADEVIQTLVLSLTNHPEITGVSISVENIEQIFNEHGVPYSEPVTRETFVPTGSL